MRKPREHADRVAVRRRRVSALLLRGLTQREIVQRLADPPEADERVVNFITGEPYSLATVHRDIKSLHRQWVKNAALDIAEHKARVLAQLHEVYRAAWAKGQLGVVLQALAQEARLVGLENPVAIDLQADRQPIKLIEIRLPYIPDGAIVDRDHTVHTRRSEAG